MTKPIGLVFAFSLLTSVSGCGAELVGGTSDSGDDGGGGVDAGADLIGDIDLQPTPDDLDGDGLPNDVEDVNLDGIYQPDSRETDLNDPDTDDDGLIDGQEDANHNGRVDDGETDPRLADTDGDGLSDGAEIGTYGTDPRLFDSDGDGLSDGDEVNIVGTDPRNPDSDNDGLVDGDEDRNGNGVLDPTETDPNRQDTDGDGVLDASEPVQIACAASRQPPVTIFEDSFGDWSVVLPDGFDESGLFTLPGNGVDLLRGGYFQQSAGQVFGFVLIKVPDAGVRLGIEQAETEANRMRSLGEVSGKRASALIAWDLFTAGVVELNLSFEESLSASQVRDQVAAAMALRGVFELGTPAAPVGPVATDWTLRYSATLRTAERVVLAAALAPASAVADDSRVAQRLVDVTDTTPISQYGDQLDRACADVPPAIGSFEADFLWLVDRSLSMAEERDQVVAVSETFFNTLSSTLLDFRIAVASTGMHTDDSWVLVTPGFSRARNDFVSQMNDPPGSDLEHGLATGLNIARLARGPATSGGTHVRSGAKLIVVFLSDEQDQGVDLLFDQGVPGCDPTDLDLAECDPLQQQIEAYQEADITAFAITGDLPGGCGAVGTGVGVADEPGHGYVQTAFATGGGFGSICSPDLQAPIDEMIRAAFGAASTYRLTPPPIAHTLRVVVDGELLERSRANGFDYDPVAQSLVFYGAGRPTLEAEITVSYRYFLDLTEDPAPDPIREQ